MHRAQKITNDPIASVGISKNAASSNPVGEGRPQEPAYGIRYRDDHDEGGGQSHRGTTDRAGHHPGLREDGETCGRVEEEHGPQSVQLPSLDGIMQTPSARSLLLAFRAGRVLRKADFLGRVSDEAGGPADDHSVDDPKEVEGLERPARR